MWARFAVALVCLAGLPAQASTIRHYDLWLRYESESFTGIDIYDPATGEDIAHVGPGAPPGLASSFSGLSPGDLVLASILVDLRYPDPDDGFSGDGDVTCAIGPVTCRGPIYYPIHAAPDRVSFWVEGYDVNNVFVDGGTTPGADFLFAHADQYRWEPLADGRLARYVDYYVDFTVVAAPVPLPASLPALAVALLAFGLVRVRRW